MGICTDHCSRRLGLFNLVSLTLWMLLVSHEVTAAPSETTGGGHSSIRIADHDRISSSGTRGRSRSNSVIQRRMDVQMQTSDTKDINSFADHVKIAEVAAGRTLPHHHQTRQQSRVQRRMNTELFASSSLDSKNMQSDPLDRQKLPQQKHEVREFGNVDVLIAESTVSHRTRQYTTRMDLDLTTVSESSSAEAAMHQRSSDYQMQPLRRTLCTYTITTETGKKFGAGTDSTISLSLYNSNEDRVYFPSLDNGNNNFEKGHIDTFSELGPCVERICKMVLSTDNSGLFSDWFVEALNFSVTTPVSDYQEKQWVLHQWLPSDDDSASLFITKDDCSNSIAPPSPFGP
ncbi:hypothetical protein R1flu_020362 [Riccia fluitans]|uniref:PLAT domain-containing protein n=1 Tax=Riccia fluitans TaxID=41844 RepID=A0ABD1ZQ23_9MARC